MSETQAPTGLMQAIAPVVKRRPVQIIVSDGTDGTLHVVFQPIRVDDKEDGEVARGFSIKASPEELDADLPQHLAEHWVPARMGLQSVVDQIKNAAEQTRQTTVAKAKEGKGGGGKKSGAPADAGAQTTILSPPAAGTPPQPAPPAGLTGGADEVPETAAEPATDPAEEAAPAPVAAGEEPVPGPNAPSTPPVTAAAASEPVPTATADGVSDLFE
jgi:PRTRC genetic system protein E